jgi:4-hydroxybenzoate polyprenyltransferase
MTLADLRDLSRPFTLLPPLLGIVSGAVCAFGSVHNPDPAHRLTWTVVATVILGSACASAMNAASNILNQIADLEIDRVNKPGRPLPSGRVSLGEAWAVTVVLYLVALLPTWLVVPHPYDTFIAKLTAPVTTHVCFFIYLAALLFTLVYSLPGLGRSKRLGWLANLTIAIPRGTLLKVGGWSMVAPVWSAEPWWIGAIFGLFLLGASSTKDFSDMEGDARGGCRTLPIIYGPRRAVLLMAPSFIVPWLLMPLGALLPDPAQPAHPILTGHGAMLVVLGLVLCAWGVYTIHLMLRDPKALASVENHPSWTHMYLMMMTAQVGFAVAYL